MEGKSLCYLLHYHVGGLNQRKLLSFCLHEEHRDEICLSLVENLLTLDGAGQTGRTLGSANCSSLAKFI